MNAVLFQLLQAACIIALAGHFYAAVGGWLARQPAPVPAIDPARAARGAAARKVYNRPRGRK